MKASAGNRRILMLLGNNPYPRDVRVRRESRTLAEAGYDVTVICPRAAGEPARETVAGVAVHRYRPPRPPRGFFGYVVEYLHAALAALVVSVRVARQSGVDVVHAHNPPDTFVLVGAVYKLLGKQFVFDHHDLAPEMYDALAGGRGNRLVRGVLVLLEQLSCRLADQVIATNESYRAIEIERGKVGPDRITVVRNASGLGDVRAARPDPELRARASTIIGFLGVMGYHDGVEHLLRAVHHLVYDLGRKDALCVLIGTGDARDDLIRLAHELALDEHAWFTGFIPMSDVLRYLATTDVCVDPDPLNPFTARSTMIKVMDYMALGKPIVAFDLPEHRETAQAAALYALPNDDLDLARGIDTLMKDPVRRAEMGEFGRRRSEAHLAWSSSAAQLLEAYRTLDARVAAPRPRVTAPQSSG
jgi:glycosyltransferase involved in cell wall biosynthesis